MTDNPITTNRKQAVSRDLDAHCAWLNSLGWVRASGVPYHIAERTAPEGRLERYLHRNG